MFDTVIGLAKTNISLAENVAVSNWLINEYDGNYRAHLTVEVFN